MIYTCNKDSNAHKYLKNKEITEINVDYPDPSNKFALTLYFSGLFQHDFSDTIAKDIKKYGINQNALYIKFVYTILFKRAENLPKIVLTSLESYRTVASLLEYSLEVFSSKCSNPKEIYDFFSYLALISTGLSEVELRALMEETQYLASLLNFFDFIIYKDKNRYSLSNNCFKSTIIEKYIINPEVFHSQIANVLIRLSPNRCSDIVYHICKSKD